VINSTGKTILSSVILLTLAVLPGKLQAATSEPSSPARATLKSSALVSQSEIKADCLIKADCNSEFRNELANIHLGVIPDPLGELVISETELRNKLGKMSGRLDLPKKVVIRRQGAFLKSTDVIAKIKTICNPDQNPNIEIDTSRIPNNIILPGNLQSWALSANSDNRLGMRLFSLTAETDGGKFRQLVQVSVVKIIEAAELTRLAKPGELISSEMIGKKRVELKSEQANLPMRYEDVVGKYLARYKSAGTILRSTDLAKDAENVCKTKNGNLPRKTSNFSNNRENWVVKPGEEVEFHFANGTLNLNFPARAMEGGQVGDQINLINLKNQKKVQGVITEKGRVEYAKN